MYTTIFEVKGCGRFPFDMLRRDRCHPVYESETPVLFQRGERTIVLATHHDRQSNGWPTVPRWRSFGWEVTNVETEGD